MPMFSASTIGGALAAVIVLTPAGIGAADEPPPYESATQAYRQGVSAMKSGEMTAAVAALEYAAGRGVLGAQLKLARLYAAGRDVPKDDTKAFFDERVRVLCAQMMARTEIQATRTKLKRPIENFETSLKVLLRLARRQHQRVPPGSAGLPMVRPPKFMPPPKV